MDLPGLMAAIEEFLDDQLDGAKALAVTIHIKDGDDFHTHYFSPRRRRRETLEPVAEERSEKLQRSATRVTIQQHEKEEETPPAEPSKPPPKFIPNDFQADIMSALEFRAFRSDALVSELGCDRRRLWKPGGIKELVAEGWVKLDTDKRLGYYRPDAPPDELKKRTYSDEPEDES